MLLTPAQLSEGVNLLDDAHVTLALSLDSNAARATTNVWGTFGYEPNVKIR